MRERIIRFMAGRNGNDQLNRFLLGLTLLLLLLSVIFSASVGRVLSSFVLLLLVICYYRMFSRDLLRRSEENGRYLRALETIRGALRLKKQQWVQRRDYKFFRCPSCRTVLRVPRGRGKLKIVCRKCGSSFTGKS